MGNKNCVPGSWVLVYDTNNGIDKTNWYVSMDELNNMTKLSKNKKNSLKSEDFIELTWKDSYNISYQLLFNKVCYDRKKSIVSMMLYFIGEGLLFTNGFCQMRLWRSC